MADIRALCFDVFGTVVDWRTSIIDEGKAINRDRNLAIDWASFADQWRGMYQPAMEQVRSGQRAWTVLDTLHRESLDKLMSDHGLDSWSEEDRDWLNKVWHRLNPWPDSVAGLQRLKQKFIIATCSNGNVSLIVDMAKRAELPWDMVLGAEVTRHYKPQDEAYLESARMLGLKPEQVCMVAAHNGDLISAAGNGLRTAFVARPEEYGPHQDKDFEAENEYDFIARDFIDLADQMGA